jgi:hypothetical protein
MTTGKRLVVGIGFALLTALGAAPAQAQYGYPPPPPPRGVYRDGLTFGGSIGAGSISAENCGVYCGGSGMIEGHIGGMLNPRLALMGDFWSAGHPWDNGYGTGTTLHTIYTVAVQYWATDIIWLKGGVGGGNMHLGYDNAPGSDENGMALMVAGGVELVQSYNFALDLHLRLGHGFYSQGGDVNTVGLMIGVNWY